MLINAMNLALQKLEMVERWLITFQSQSRKLERQLPCRCKYTDNSNFIKQQFCFTDNSDFINQQHHQSSLSSSLPLNKSKWVFLDWKYTFWCSYSRLFNSFKWWQWWWWWWWYIVLSNAQLSQKDQNEILNWKYVVPFLWSRGRFNFEACQLHHCFPFQILKLFWGC